ncbi:hypothetical protein FOZ60_001070 [Perkinsus olseni]|uniref:Uncharacterized protein n=1 Tax=Perkinsus olseni TaxID=32597 RepID=A0A7J6MUN1_PEROL|nr:hypothetical protein FOZ60_001070 [Perkinsus olseni]
MAVLNMLRLVIDNWVVTFDDERLHCVVFDGKYKTWYYADHPERRDPVRVTSGDVLLAMRKHSVEGSSTRYAVLYGKDREAVVAFCVFGDYGPMYIVDDTYRVEDSTIELSFDHSVLTATTPPYESTATEGPMMESTTTECPMMESTTTEGPMMESTTTEPAVVTSPPAGDTTLTSPVANTAVYRLTLLSNLYPPIPGRTLYTFRSRKCWDTDLRDAHGHWTGVTYDEAQAMLQLTFRTTNTAANAELTGMDALAPHMRTKSPRMRLHHFARHGTPSDRMAYMSMFSTRYQDPANPFRREGPLQGPGQTLGRLMDDVAECTAWARPARSVAGTSTPSERPVEIEEVVAEIVPDGMDGKAPERPDAGTSSCSKDGPTS